MEQTQGLGMVYIVKYLSCGTLVVRLYMHDIVLFHHLDFSLEGLHQRLKVTAQKLRYSTSTLRVDVRETDVITQI